MTKIYFIRHTSVAVPRGTCYGWTDVDVAETFEDEARHTLTELGGIRFDRVFCSPLSRARRLAAFCGYPDATIDERVKELNFGEWEMQNYDDLFHDDPRFAIWCDNVLTEHTPQGECVADQQARVVSFIEHIKTLNIAGSVAVFCHGGVQALAMVYDGRYSIDEAFSHVPPYGSIISIEV